MVTDLHARLRLLESDHEPDGCPAVQMRDISALLNEVDRLKLLCQTVHDRLLRGESDAKLLERLETAWDPDGEDKARRMMNPHGAWL